MPLNTSFFQKNKRRQFYDDDTIDFTKVSTQTEIAVNASAVEVDAAVTQEMLTSFASPASRALHQPGQAIEPGMATIAGKNDKPDEPQQIPEGVKQAMQVLSKTHAEWDRKAREFASTAQTSKTLQADHGLLLREEA